MTQQLSINKKTLNVEDGEYLLYDAIKELSANIEKLMQVMI